VVPLGIGVILAIVFGGWESIGAAIVVGLALIVMLVIGVRLVFRESGRVARMVDAQLEQAEMQRRQLLADVGHELRTPLTVIRGEVEAFIDGVHEPDEARLSELLEDVAVMERLIDDLHTLSTGEAGQLALHPEPTDLVDLATSVVHNFASSQPPVTIEPTDEDVDAEIDPIRIREVLTNLLTNAVRATSANGHVTVRVGRSLSPHHSATIEVADTGTGMEPERLSSVFDRFEKGADSDGSGLGLTISRHLVEAHGGTIRINSDAGQGTTVTVEL
jgi:two-component system sensor histidine kinase BaeS